MHSLFRAGGSDFSRPHYVLFGKCNSTTYREYFYKQINGIVTGDNNSVSIANIALDHVLLQIVPTLKSTIIIKRYIDDIIFTSKTKETTNKIKEKL